MIYGPNNYMGCRVIVYSEAGGSAIAESVISKFDRTTRTMTIPRSAFRTMPPEKVSVLIFFKDTLHEFMGTVRRSSAESSGYTIGLYKGKERESRRSVRYRVDAPVAVDSCIANGKPVSLPGSLALRVLDISTTGCRLGGGRDTLAVGMQLGMTLDMGGSPVKLRATVLRADKIDEEHMSFGCKF